MKLIKLLLLLCLFVFCACVKKDEPNVICSTEKLLDSFTTQEGLEVFIYENGELYIQEDENCVFEALYFNPDQLANSYIINATDTLLVAGDTFFSVKNNYIEDFEFAASFNDLFVASVNDTALYWTSFTLQSPATPTVAQYVALRKCILDESCTFIDNIIELAEDPTNAANKVLKFTSVAPTENMVTAKASISSQLNYFVQGSHFWVQSDFYIESGSPFSLMDFESGYFVESPGPRVVLRNGKLEIENKFSEKTNYDNPTNVAVPVGEWFTVKVHLKYSSNEDGIIELWQDGQLLISTTGINLPLPNAIQDILEIGVSATPEGSVMYMDNFRISDREF